MNPAVSLKITSAPVVPLEKLQPQKYLLLVFDLCNSRTQSKDSSSSQRGAAYKAGFNLGTSL